MPRKQSLFVYITVGIVGSSYERHAMWSVNSSLYNQGIKPYFSTEVPTTTTLPKTPICLTSSSLRYSRSVSSSQNQLEPPLKSLVVKFTEVAVVTPNVEGTIGASNRIFSGCVACFHPSHSHEGDGEFLCGITLASPCLPFLHIFLQLGSRGK